MVKNEEDTIAHVIEHLLAEGIDRIIVADNLSTDTTRSVLDGLVARGWPVTVIDDPEVAYLQGVKMTRLANIACEAGAEWIIPFDADELWVTTDPSQSLGGLLRNSTDADVLVGEWYDHVPTIFPALGRTCFGRMSRRDCHPSVYHKVAFRAHPHMSITQGNHSVEGVERLRQIQGRFIVHHYRWRSLKHFVTKNRNGLRVYEAAGKDLDPGWGMEWRKYGQRSLPHLILTYLNLIRFQLLRGTIRDARQPSRLSSPR